MKRETIERQLEEARGAIDADAFSPRVVLGLLNREQERLTEQLAELDAREKSAPQEEVPGYTDSYGDRWYFVQHSSGQWVAICIESNTKFPHVISDYYPECFDHVREALRAWLKETGRA